MNGILGAPRPPAGILHRQRLTDLIDRSLEHSSGVLLLGPSGSGKSTALADWAATSTHPAVKVWLSIDEASRTREGFWRLVTDRLMAAGLLGECGSADKVRYDDDHLTPLPQQLAFDLNGSGKHVLLLIDGGERLATRQIAYDVFAFCRYAHNLQTISTGRMTQPDIDAGLAAVGAAVIPPDEFALTLEECEQLLVTEVGPEAAALAPTLQEETGGWPLPVRLVLPKIARTPSGQWDALVRSTAAAFYNSRIVDSIDVPGAGDFVAVTSLAESFSPDLAASLTGLDLESIDHLVDQLGHRGLGSWLPSLESEYGLFRYHDMLLSIVDEYQQRLPAEQRRAAHQTIARWAAPRGDIHTAALHAALAEDVEFLASLVIDHVQTIFGARDESVEAALEAISSERLYTEPILLLLRGLVRSEIPENAWASQNDLRVAAELAGSQLPGSRGARRLTLLLIRIVAQRVSGQWDALAQDLARAERALDEHAERDDVRTREIRQHLRLEAAAGRFRLGQLDAARAQAELVFEPSALQREPMIDTGAALGLIALTAALAGDMDEAKRATQRGFAQQKPYGWQSGYHGVPLQLAATLIALEQGEIARAREHLHAIDPDVARLEYWPEVVRATSWVLLVEQNVPAISAHLQRSIEQYSHRVPLSPWGHTRTFVLWAIACAVDGQTRQAADHLASLPGDHPSVRAARALLALYTQRFDEAIALGDALSADSSSWLRVRVYGGVIAAAGLWSQGNREAALRYYRTAVAGARPGGLTLPVRLLPETVGRELLAGWAEGEGLAITDDGHITVDGVASAELSPADAKTIELWNQPIGVAPKRSVQLTEREQEILLLLSEGATTAQMASTLYVTANTIKSQRSALYRKLSATSRDEALQRAHELGVFSPAPHRSGPTARPPRTSAPRHR